MHHCPWGNVHPRQMMLIFTRIYISGILKNFLSLLPNQNSLFRLWYTQQNWDELIQIGNPYVNIQMQMDQELRNENYRLGLVTFKLTMLTNFSFYSCSRAETLVFETRGKLNLTVLVSEDEDNEYNVQ